tara:strand:- start:13728 stop:13904 length:177 start_codon:yes stop_codon:yes gene_type:complete
MAAVEVVLVSLALGERAVTGQLLLLMMVLPLRQLLMELGAEGEADLVSHILLVLVGMV